MGFLNKEVFVENVCDCLRLLCPDRREGSFTVGDCTLDCTLDLTVMFVCDSSSLLLSIVFRCKTLKLTYVSDLMGILLRFSPSLDITIGVINYESRFEDFLASLPLVVCSLLSMDWFKKSTSNNVGGETLRFLMWRFFCTKVGNSSGW